MTCANLCTADKCAELEARIQELERKLETHLDTKIPEAHKWDGSFNLNFSVYEKTLTLDLHIDNIDSKAASIDLPFVTQNTFNSHLLANVNADTNLAHSYYPEIDHNLTVYNTQDGIALYSEIFLEGYLASDLAKINLNNIDTNLKIGGTVIGRNLILTVADRNSSDTEEIPLPFTFINEFENHLRDEIPQAHKYNPLVKVNADIEENTLFIDVAVDDNSDVATVELNEIDSNLKIGGTVIDRNLILTVADRNSSDTEEIPLPFTFINDFENHLRDDHNMNCEELETLINTRSDEIKKDIENKGEQIKQAVNFEGDELKNMLQKESDIIQSVIDSQECDNNDYIINRIYSILGGSYWDNPELKLKAEANLKNIGKQQFTEEAEDVAVPINNFLDLIKSYHSVSYHRAGYHRLPATLIESIIKSSEEEDRTITISDSLSFQEWIFRQIDAISGQYPIKFDYKIKDEKGKDKIETVEIPNSAEALTQILAILLAVSEESDMNLNATMRCLAEARSGANSAILAYDFARANAEYLGYRGKERKKEIDISFTPGSQTIRESLQPSKQKLIGWEFDDRESLVELIKKILFSSEIIKAAMYIPFDSEEDKITGDAIKETIEQEKSQQEQEWEKFKNIINNPTGKYRVPKPKANLKDLTVDKD